MADLQGLCAVNLEGGAHLNEVREVTGMDKSRLREEIAGLNRRLETPFLLGDDHKLRFAAPPPPAAELEMLLQFGMRCFGRGLWEQARKCFTLMFLRHDDAGDRATASKDLGNAGVACLKDERPAEALNYFEKAYEIHLELNDSAGLARDAANIGAALATLGRREEALVKLSEALAIFEKNGETEQAVKVGGDRDMLAAALKE